MDLRILLPQVIVNGLATGSVYVLMALGFTVVFGIMKIVNFAHGAFYMLGAYGLYAFYVKYELPYPLAVVLIVILVGLTGAIIERTVVRRVAGDGLATLILTLGLSLIIQSGLELTFGVNPMPTPAVASGPISLGGVFVPKSRLLVMVIAVAVLALLYIFISRSKWGRAMRAVSQDPETATAQGIPTKRVFPLAFGGAALLAALAGALLAPVFFVSPVIGEAALIKSFIVVIIGGMGSIPGAVVAGFLVGLIEAGSTTFLGAEVTSLLIYALVIVVMLIRPAGLFGRTALRA